MAGQQSIAGPSASSVSRRTILVGIGAAVAVPVVQSLAGPAESPVAPIGAAPLDVVRRWYETTVDALVRGWEPRFRFRQYRPDEPDSEDWESRAAPRDELGHALARLPVLQDEASTHLVLAASEQTYGDDDCAADRMALDVLAHAERLGYFAEPCPEALRFPDLPAGGYMEDDFKETERELETAHNCETILRSTLALDGLRGNVVPKDIAKRDEYRAKGAALEARLAGMRDGSIPALTEAQKVTRHAALRREIVLTYKARLEAAGHDASWVEVPPYWREERLAQEARS
jgi:hypothetical protein